MDSETFTKLQRHIEKFGRYEPLTVRPHPDQPDKFQVVNGHHRMRALQSLGHGTAHCNVWELDDDQTRLYLATLNRLAGQDVPERRAILLEELLAHHELSELVGLLPDPESDLATVAQFDDTDIAVREDEVLLIEEADLPQMITFMLSEEHARELNAAIDRMIQEEERNMSRGEAVVAIARCYLDRAG
jgi:ParB-like chromosome segregation protein Spo0J